MKDDILIHFLNDVIEKENKKEITNVRLLNPIQHPEVIGKIAEFCDQKRKRPLYDIRS